MRVVFRSHPLLGAEEYYITIPKKNATLDDLRQHMSETPRFEKHGWVLVEFRFFAVSWSHGVMVELDGDGPLDDFGTLRRKLIQNLTWQEGSSDEENPRDAIV